MELASVAPAVSDPAASVNVGNLPSVIHAAMRQDLALDPTRKDQILAQVSSLRTRADAAKYLEQVREDQQRSFDSTCRKFHPGDVVTER
jgi:hypothetical protein